MFFFYVIYFSDANQNFYQPLRQSSVGLGTELGTFKGTDRIASVLPNIDSH